MAENIRVGVIGTGFGSQIVGPAYASLPGCEVVEIVSPRDAAAVAALCERPDLDLVSVHSPPFLHLDHVRRAVEAGHAVLCDKPFGRNAAESAEMVSLASDAGVLGFVNFERRYDPTRVRLRELLRDGAVGEPKHFQYSRFIAVPEPRPYTWLNDRAAGGGWLGGQASHLIDATRWLFGEITSAAAVMQTLVPSRVDADGVSHACDAEDAVTAMLRTQGGVSAVIDVAIDSSVALPERTAVLGTSGMLTIEDNRVVRHAVDGPIDVHEVDFAGTPALLLSMQRWAQIVCDAIRTGVVPEGAPTFADGLACARVMDDLRATAI
jgi:predicted dehydrogenase